MTLTQCMGGWCRQREKCPHYWAPKQRQAQPAERLCATGRDWERLERLERNPDGYRMALVGAQPVTPGDSRGRVFAGGAAC